MQALQSFALNPYTPLDKDNPLISAPFDVVKVKRINGHLKFHFKANDSQRSFYSFFNLIVIEEVVEIFVRRKINKEQGLRAKEQDFLIDLSPFPIFNKPLTLRLYRRTTRGQKLIHEEALKP